MAAGAIEVESWGPTYQKNPSLDDPVIGYQPITSTVTPPGHSMYYGGDDCCRHRVGQLPDEWLQRYRGINAMSRKDLLPGAGPVLNTRQALYRATRDAPGGQNAVALTIGMDPDELSKRVNPTNNRPLHPEFLEEIIAATRDPRLLAALVRPAGAVAFVPVPVPATRDALKALGQLLQAEGEFVGSLHAGAADNVWEHHEVETLRYHANRMIGEILGIVAGAEQAMEELCHG